MSTYHSIEASCVIQILIKNSLKNKMLIYLKLFKLTFRLMTFANGGKKNRSTIVYWKYFSQLVYDLLLDALGMSQTLT